jgi:hypothetical protein
MADGGMWWQRETVRGFTPHMAEGNGKLQDGENIPPYRVRRQ